MGAAHFEIGQQNSAPPRVLGLTVQHFHREHVFDGPTPAPSQPRGYTAAMRRRLMMLLLLSACACSATRIYDVSSSETASGGMLVHARVDDQGATPSAQLVLRYRIGLDNGTKTNLALSESRGLWSATVRPGSPSFVTAGSLFRYSVLALGAGGAEVARVEGPPTVVSAQKLQSQSKLPTLFWYVGDPQQARSDTPTPSLVLFDAHDGGGLRWYGNVSVHRSGSERHTGLSNMWDKRKSKDWPKSNFKFSFHKTAPDNPASGAFVWMPGWPGAKAITLHSMFMESGPTSYMRKALALRFMDALGVPASGSRYVRVMQNGAFYGLYLLVEEVDAQFLARRGMDPNGRLFKAAHWKYSGLRVPDNSECPFTAPDHDYWPRGKAQCPVIFSEVGVPNGGTPHLGDLQALAQSVAAGDLSRFDMSNVVTEMAVQTAMLHQDRCVKNRFYYEDLSSGSPKWTVIPFDLKDSFATDNRGDGRSCAAEGKPCSHQPTYCILSCEAFNSPLFCDAAHPQDTFPESDGRSTYNHLVDAVLKNPAWRAAYFLKLRYVMDTYLSSGWLQAQVAHIRELITDEARADHAKWHAGDIDAGVAALLEQMRVRRGQLYGTYGAMIGAGRVRPYGGRTPGALEGKEAIAPTPMSGWDVDEESSSSSDGWPWAEAEAPAPGAWRTITKPL